jgi:hypothetical protein
MLMAAFTSAWPAKPQAVHTKRAWLSRDSGSTCPHAEHRWLVNAGLTFSTRPGALSCSRRTSSPHPDRKIPRFSPALARTFRPGFPRVPLADRVMFAIFRSSTRIRSNRRAMAVLAFSAQSLRRSGSQPGDRVPDPAAAVRTPRSAGEPALQPPQPGPLPPGQGGAGQQLAGGQRRGDRHAPVNAHRLAVAGCRDRIGGHGEGDMPAARPVHDHPVGLCAGGDGAGPAEPDPAGLGHPDLPDVAGYAAQIPLPAAAHDAESLIAPGLAPGLAPGRPPGRVARVEERCHRPGEVAQGLLLDGLGAGRQPRVLGPRGGELPALLEVAGSALAAGVPVGVLFDGEVPDVPGVAAVVPQHCLLGRGGGSSRYRDMRIY